MRGFFLTALLLLPFELYAQVVDKNSVDSLREKIIPELYQSVRDGRISFTVKGGGVLSAGETPEASALLEEIVNRQKQYAYSLDILNVASKNEKNQQSVFSAELLKIFISDEKKEKITFTSPQQLKDYIFYTIRKIGAEEDRYSVFSPLLGNLRELTGTNRSDSLFTSSFALDDLEGWSGKPEWVSAVAVSSGVWFSPPQLPVEIKEDEKCKTLDSSGLGATSLIFNDLMPSASFTLRELFRIELKQEDIFSRYGKQILYVDPLTLSVIYKAVLDDSGSLQKIVFSGFTNDGVPAYTVANDLSRAISSLVTYQSSKRCASIPDKFNLETFDPKPAIKPELGKERAKATPPTS